MTVKEWATKNKETQLAIWFFRYEKLVDVEKKAKFLPSYLRVINKIKKTIRGEK